MRALRVLGPVVLAALAAIVGTVLNYVVIRYVSGGGSTTLRLLVTGRMQPFSGRIMGRGTAFQDVGAWLVGLVVMVVVLALFLGLLGRSGRTAAFLAGWLGTIVATAAAALVAGLVYLSRLYPGTSGSSSFPIRTQFLVSTFGNGLYWGLFVGFVIGLVALLFGGPRRDRTPAGPTTPTTTSAPPPTDAAPPR